MLSPRDVCTCVLRGGHVFSLCCASFVRLCWSVVSGAARASAACHTSHTETTDRRTCTTTTHRMNTHNKQQQQAHTRNTRKHQHKHRKQHHAATLDTVTRHDTTRPSSIRPVPCSCVACLLFPPAAALLATSEHSCVSYPLHCPTLRVTADQRHACGMRSADLKQRRACTKRIDTRISYYRYDVS